MIEYSEKVDDLSAGQLEGFFVGWPDPPSAETHLKLLQNSYAVVLAKDSGTGRVVGFINAIGDGVLSAYIPLLEVLPSYQRRGIGGELVRRMIEKLKALYMIDLVCDERLVDFYREFGMKPYRAMMIRNFQYQSGSV